MTLQVDGYVPYLQAGAQQQDVPESLLRALKESVYAVPAVDPEVPDTGGSSASAGPESSNGAHDHELGLGNPDTLSDVLAPLTEDSGYSPSEPADSKHESLQNRPSHEAPPGMSEEERFYTLLPPS